MHQHEWTEIARMVAGESVDTYSSCKCGWVRHVYTYDPGGIRYENMHEPLSYSAGFAHGLARGLRG